MKLTVATTWDDEFIEQISILNRCAKNKVVEVFGSKKIDFLGSARPSNVLPDVSIKQLKEHIMLCHKKGIKFNYVINAPSFRLKEFDPDFRRKLVDFVSELISNKIDAVTIANPIIIETLRKNFPKLPICASTVCKVDTLRRVKWYTELGVNRIILETDINRDFNLLKKIRKITTVELEVLANLQCVFQCPNNTYDYVCDGFRSQSVQKGVFYNYPKIKCTNIKLKNPVEFIKSPWIRPEDLNQYGCIDYVKIAGREAPTGWLLNAVKAYMIESYTGNLFDLIGHQVISETGRIKLPGHKELKPLNIILQNKKLPGFLKYFIAGNCTTDCISCRYCNKYAHLVKIDSKQKAAYINRSNLLLSKIRRNYI